MSDNVAVLAGFTQEVLMESAACDLRLMVKPGTDYDLGFKAWDLDEQEWLWVSGWLFDHVSEVAA